MGKQRFERVWQGPNCDGKTTHHTTAHPQGSRGVHASMGQDCFSSKRGTITVSSQAGGHNVMPDRCMSESPWMILLRVLSASVIELSTEQMWNKHKYKVLTSSTEDIYKLTVFQMKRSSLISENTLKYSWDVYLLINNWKIWFFFSKYEYHDYLSFFHKMCFLGQQPLWKGMHRQVDKANPPNVEYRVTYNI